MQYAYILLLILVVCILRSYYIQEFTLAVVNLGALLLVYDTS